MPRMPWTIWKHTTVELWKLLLLTTAVLVGVISFAVTIKPLADGELSAFDAIRFMILATVPMLSYALPFGAGFAATLVFHRMAQDNELSASHAGGISHAKLLVPAAVSGLVLAVIVGLLSDQVIPRFLRTMERMITEDVARLMVGRLSAGETVQFNGNLIYADSVQRIDPSTMRNAAGAEDVISLYRPVFGRLDEHAKLDAGGTAERAFIVIYRDGEENRGAGSIVRLVASNYNSWGNTFVAESTDQLVYDFAIPGAFRDDPKFRSFNELGGLQDNPKLLPVLNSNHNLLALRAASLAMLQEVDLSLRDTGSVTLDTTQGETVTIRARGLGRLDWLSRPILPGEGGEIVVERRREGGQITRMTAAAGTIDTKQLDELAATRVLAKITLSEVTTNTDEAAGRRRDQQITGLLAQNDQTASLSSLGFYELLEQTGTGTEGVPPALVDLQKYSLRRNGLLQREIVSKSHMRIAMSAACFVMLLVGATVAIRLREALPLTVYLWAFFPALGAVLAISTAEQFAQDSGLFGLILMWAAVLGLLMYAYLTYRRVALR
ncbi:MAG: LptF/LptG family permease [Phycisphaerales bacterium JB058]